MLGANNATAAETGNLAVTVAGSKIANVKVEISGDNLDTPVERRTSSVGKVTFKDLTPGTYTVTPRKAGSVFSPGVKSIVVTAGATKRLKIVSGEMVAKVGMAYCVGCHARYTPDIYTDWINSPHGNFEYVDAAHKQFGYDDFVGGSFSYPADHTRFTGFPSNASIVETLKDPAYKGLTRAYCVSCHGPWSEDNKKAAKFPLVRADGTIDTVNSKQAARPVVGCEACHGGGKKHIARPGKGVTFKEPTATQCGECHNSKFPASHLKYHPAGAAGQSNPGIYEAYQASPHANSINDSIYTDASKKTVKALCAKCHTDEGARVYKAIDGDGITLPAKLNGEAAHARFSAVQCRTCHDAHNPEKLLEPASAATSSATARSAEFNTCTNCHQLLDDRDQKASPFHGTHAKSITSTHYDDPATQAFEGYNVSRAKATACSDCHNPHVAITEINEQWAESAHGERTGEGWVHYDWKATNRQACQRCHSATGFLNYVADPVNYSAAKNDFSHLTGMQNETLYCNGCHSDSAFNMRKLATVTFPSTKTASLGDASNLCMACHQGRAAKATVDAAIAKGAPPYTSFTNIHYLPAAAILFGTEVQGGYEYAGKTYVGRNTFPGHSGQKDTCVKCHLRTADSENADHSFMPKVTDCNTCHAGITALDQIGSAVDYDGNGSVEEGLKAEIEGLQAKLLPQIMAYATNTVLFPIVYDSHSNPYWFRDTNGNGVKDAGETTGYNKFDAKLLKAAYNYHTSIKEPGAFVHNHKYVIQLLVDSIEDLGGSTVGLTRP